MAFAHCQSGLMERYRQKDGMKSVCQQRCSIHDLKIDLRTKDFLDLMRETVSKTGVKAEAKGVCLE